MAEPEGIVLRYWFVQSLLISKKRVKERCAHKQEATKTKVVIDYMVEKSAANSTV
jgi:hypothetical protein